jgi:hypothetical protein
VTPPAEDVIAPNILEWIVSQAFSDPAPPIITTYNSTITTLSSPPSVAPVAASFADSNTVSSHCVTVSTSCVVAASVEYSSPSLQPEASYTAAAVAALGDEELADTIFNRIILPYLRRTSNCTEAIAFRADMYNALFKPRVLSVIHSRTTPPNRVFTFFTSISSYSQSFRNFDSFN